jgi:hypothetical protein
VPKIKCQFKGNIAGLDLTVQFFLFAAVRWSGIIWKKERRMVLVPGWGSRPNPSPPEDNEKWLFILIAIVAFFIVAFFAVVMIRMLIF